MHSPIVKTTFGRALHSPTWFTPVVPEAPGPSPRPAIARRLERRQNLEHGGSRFGAALALVVVVWDDLIDGVAEPGPGVSHEESCILRSILNGAMLKRATLP